MLGKSPYEILTPDTQFLQEKAMDVLLIGLQQQQSMVAHLLRAGGATGLVMLALGGVMTLWGVINLLNRPGRSVMLMQALCSLLPAVLAIGIAGSAYSEFVRIAAAAEPPRPVEFARLISGGLFAGMIGPLATVVPAALGIVGLARGTSNAAGDEPV